MEVFAIGHSHRNLNKETAFMDAMEKMRKRDALRAAFGSINDIIKRTSITEGDVGKIFVMNLDQTIGQLMDREDFLAMEIEDIGGWIRVGQFHINA